MNNSHIKNNRHNNSTSTDSLRGEAPQKHGVKRKKSRKQNPEAAAARKALIAMSQTAQDMIDSGMITEEFEGCIKVNDFLMVMHQKASGCQDFRTFHNWKKAGFKVKKGAKSYRVWGSPLDAKKQEAQQAAADGNSSSDAVDTFKYWPMCSLFNESQVEPLDSGFTTYENTDTTTAGQGDDSAPSRSEATEHNQHAEPRALSPFVTIDYEEQQAVRKDRAQARAEKAKADSQATYRRAKDMASVIVFGQPILVGHHSEQRDRRYRKRIHDTYGKAFALQDKADHYQRKADNMGNAGIASNDPEALTKLNAKLVDLQQSQETMKAVNKIIRRKGLSDDEKAAAIVAAKLLPAARATEILKSDFSGRIGFASYALSNNNAEINRVKQRIKALESLRNSEPIAFENDDFAMHIENGRVCITFSEGKPSDEVRTMLKQRAFIWSRYQTAWVRKATANGVAEARRLLAQLKTSTSIY
jgi:hypothetical protein